MVCSLYLNKYELKKKSRIDKIKAEKNAISDCVPNMNQLYKEDKALTEVTRELEGEPFLCPHCGRPMDEHELQDDFIKKILKRSQTESITINNIKDYLVI